MMKTKKHLLISADFPPVMGGIAHYNYEICLYMPKGTFEILVPKLPGSVQFDSTLPCKVKRRFFPGVEVYGSSRLASLLKPFLFAFYTFPSVLFGRVKALHCGQIISGGIVGYLWNRLFGLPYYVYIYGAEFRTHKRKMKFIKRILDRAKGVVVISRFTKQECLNAGVPLERIIIISPCTDPERFGREEDIHRLVTKYNLKGKRTLLTVARLDPHKGIDLLIKALPKIAKIVPDIRYLVVGTGPEEQKLKSLSRELGLEELVTFTGFVSDEELPVYYHLCDLFVLLSFDDPVTGYIEGFGIVYLEANAAGKAVVAGKAGGAQDAVVNRESGMFVDPHDEKMVVETITALLLNPEKTRELGEKGKDRVLRNFIWEHRSSELYEWITRKC